MWSSGCKCPILPLYGFKIKCKQCLRKHWPESSLFFFFTLVISSAAAALAESWSQSSLPLTENILTASNRKTKPLGCELRGCLAHFWWRSGFAYCALYLDLRAVGIHPFCSVGGNWGGDTGVGPTEAKILEIRWQADLTDAENIN